MAIVTPQVGDQKALTEYLSSGENWILKLYTNNTAGTGFSPAGTETIGTFTEPTFTGYTGTSGYAAATISGGTGGVAWVTITAGAISNVIVVTGGSGYTNSASATLTINANTSATVTLAVTGGSVTGTSSLVGGSGYVAGGILLTRTLTSSTWSNPTLAKPSVSYYYQNTGVTFSATSAQTVYGYFCVGVTSGILRYAEQFSSTSGISLINPSTLTVNPSYSFN